MNDRFQKEIGYMGGGTVLTKIYIRRISKIGRTLTSQARFGLKSLKIKNVK